MITPVGISETQLPDTESDSSYSVLREAVGGDMQWIPLASDSAMYINDNAKLLELPENPIATRLSLHYNTGLDPSDYIAGNAIIIGISPDGDEADTPESVRQSLLTLGFTVTPTT